MSRHTVSAKSLHNTHRLRMLRRRQRAVKTGFTMIEVMIAVVIMGILLNIATPGMIHAREGARSRACVRNLRNVDGAKEEYAIDNRIKVNGAAPTWTNLVGTTISNGYLKKQPACPSGGTYSINGIGTKPSCGIGANVSTANYDDHVM